METALYNVEGKRIGEIGLPPKIFGVAWNPELVHQVITSLQANQRSATAHTKDRGEVRGGGRKPWRQKGTGRARHGSTRSPIWIGGGVTHGPRAEKKYEKKIPKKMGKKALYTVLSQKARDAEIIVLDALTLPAMKTKEGAVLLKRFEKKGTFLVAVPRGEEPMMRVFRNMPRAAAMPARNLNALEAARFAYIVFPQQSFNEL